MKARHPIWNILVVLGVLYVIVFGFLYVYMQRNAAPAQVPEAVDESEVVAREVDILDAPLLTEQEAAAEADELEPVNGVDVDLSSEEIVNEDAPEAESTLDEPTADLSSDEDMDEAAEPAANALNADLATESDEPSSAEAETDTALSDLAETSEETDVSAVSSEEADLDSVEVGSADLDSSEIAAEEAPDVASEADPSQTDEANEPDAEVEAAPLGSSDPYRYNLNEMGKNTKIETEQGWVTYEGQVESHNATQRYFLIVQSLIKEPPTLFSQGELKLDEAGNFETRAKYATYSEFYETYIISTENEQAADTFGAEGSSSGLPSGFKVVRPVVEVLVD